MTITLTREEAQQVLDALGNCRADSEELFYDYKQKYGDHYKPQRIAFQQSVVDQAAQAIETLRARLAKPEPEPVAWIKKDRSSIEVSIMSAEYMRNAGFEPLYTAPPQRKWQGLTAYEIQELHLANPDWGNFACAIEAELKEKNT